MGVIRCDCNHYTIRINTVYFSVHYLSVFHTVQGLFQDFASEGANAKFQILGGGG